MEIGKRTDAIEIREWTRVINGKRFDFRIAKDTDGTTYIAVNYVDESNDWDEMIEIHFWSICPSGKVAGLHGKEPTLPPNKDWF